METPGIAGFTHKQSNGKYYLKNANMQPKGNRQIRPGRNLYIREPIQDGQKKKTGVKIGLKQQKDLQDL